MSSGTISKEEEEELVKRIYYRQIELAQQREEERMEALERQRKEARKVIPKSSEGDLVKRVYEHQMEQKKQTAEQNETKKQEEIHRNDKKIDSGAMDDRIRHLYDESIERKQQNEQELLRRYCPEKEPKKFSKKQIDESVARLYHVDWEARDKALFEKWVYPNDPKVAKISPSSVQSMADRLSKAE